MIYGFALIMRIDGYKKVRPKEIKAIWFVIDEYGDVITEFVYPEEKNFHLIRSK